MSDNALQLLTIVAVTAAAIGLAAGRSRVRGSTLTAPLVWGLGSLAALALAELALLFDRPPEIRPMSASVLRYVAAVSTFCPLMAVLGAKRPQDRGWQWVVVSLWIVLALPGIHALVTAGGPQMELEGPWRWFAWTLLTVSALVYLPTQFWFVSLIAIAGQFALLSPALLPAGKVRPAASAAIGASLLCAAVAIASWTSRNRNASVSLDRGRDNGLASINRRWLAFRDGWGALWALRVMLRVNHTAELQQWPVRLQLAGFRPLDGNAAEITASEAAAVAAALDAVLRRFEAEPSR